MPCLRQFKSDRAEEGNLDKFEIDPNGDRLSAAMARPQMIGRWMVRAKMHKAGVDIVAKMQR